MYSEDLNEWFENEAEKQEGTKVNNEIIIDDEIKNRLWPLNQTEYNELEKSLLKEGCREPLIVWKNILVDGHNRYEICKRFDLPYKKLNMFFENKNEVLKWVDTNQLSRRNLTDEQRTILIGRLYKSLKQEGFKGNQYIKSGGGQNGPQLKTYEKIADDLKVGINTVKRAEKYVDAIEEIERTCGKETIDKIVSGDLKISKQDVIKIAEMDPFQQEKIVRTIKEDNKNIATIIKKGEIETIRKEIDNGNIKLPEGKFEVIMMDPPWDYGTEYNQSNMLGRSATPYPTMSLEEISNIKLPASDDCILFFWTTQKFIQYSFDIIKKYGFEYKAILVWDKQKMGIGKTLRLQCEFCLIAFKGNPKWNITTLRDIISSPRREHSRKPDELYEIINENLIGRKLDYFSREKREGWETFGTNELVTLKNNKYENYEHTNI